jgi:hypothetical protein
MAEVSGIQILTPQAAELAHIYTTLGDEILQGKIALHGGMDGRRGAVFEIFI